AVQSLRARGVFLPQLWDPQLLKVPYRGYRALAPGPQARDAPLPLLSCDRHRARAAPRGPARQPAGRICPTDEGRSACHHRYCPRPPLRRRHPRRADRPPHMDPAAPLPPPRALPRYRWRRLHRSYPLLASRPPLLPCPRDSAIAKLVCGKLRAWFAQKRPDLIIPATAWTTPWVVRITPWGEGEEALLRYLARYVFRIAITNSRIVALDEHTVSFRYKHRQSNRWRTCTLDGE